jgi:hypothetical protein
MRLKVRRLWRAIKQELPIQFGHEQLTSYGGLELVRRYFQLIELKARIRRRQWEFIGQKNCLQPAQDAAGGGQPDVSDQILIRISMSRP